MINFYCFCQAKCCTILCIYLACWIATCYAVKSSWSLHETVTLWWKYSSEQKATALLSIRLHLIYRHGGKNAGFVLFPLRSLFSFCCHYWPEFITFFVSLSCLSSSSSYWPASSHLLLWCESDLFSFAPLKPHLTIQRPVKPNPICGHTFTVRK